MLVNNCFAISVDSSANGIDGVICVVGVSVAVIVVGEIVVVCGIVLALFIAEIVSVVVVVCSFVVVCAEIAVSVVVGAVVFTGVDVIAVAGGVEQGGYTECMYRLKHPDFDPFLNPYGGKIFEIYWGKSDTGNRRNKFSRFRKYIYFFLELNQKIFPPG